MKHKKRKEKAKTVAETQVVQTDFKRPELVYTPKGDGINTCILCGGSLWRLSDNRLKCGHCQHES